MKNFVELINKYPLLKLVGDTPLIEINLFKKEFPSANIFAKVEWFNPGGSIKDRPVMHMLLDAIQRGELTKHTTILDSSSGNAGIAYAMIGNALGFNVKLVMPTNVSRERKLRIAAHGAEMHFTDAFLGYDEALRTCHRMYEQNKSQYFFCDQYSNEWNWRAHYMTTAEEILRQTQGKLTHFVAGVGTGGTITGVGRKLKEINPKIKIIAVLPETFPGIEGLKPLSHPDDIRPKIFDESLIDEWVETSSEDAYEYCHKLALHGLFAGQSSGAYISAAYKIAQREKTCSIVTLFSDLGERYMSTGLWDTKQTILKTQ